MLSVTVFVLLFLEVNIMYNRRIIASYINAVGMTITVKEGLNDKNKWELELVIPKELWRLYEDRSNMKYEQRGSMYFAQDERTGRVSYFFYEKPGRGFGGYTHNLPMKDGTTAILHGPWSSNSHAMNRAGFEPSKEVTIRGRYNMADAMTVKEINRLLLPLEMEVVLIDSDPRIIRL